MITTEQLDDIKQMIEIHPEGTHAILSQEPGSYVGAWCITGSVLLEIIELAKKQLGRSDDLSKNT